MSNHWKIPKANPFFWIKTSDTPGVHLGDDWACSMIAGFETKAVYRQKWIRTKTTKIQCESSIAPQDLMILDQNGEVVKSIAWSLMFLGVGYGVYECEVDFTDLDEGVFYLYSTVVMGSIDWAMITEPIHVKDAWDNLLEYVYWNTFNDFDVAWTTGIQMRFFIESAIREYEPQRERAAYVNQVHDMEGLKSVPNDKFALWIGEAGGVSDPFMVILNYIMSCNRIEISGKMYQTDEGSKWEIRRVKNWPLVGATIDIVPARNLMSAEFADFEPLVPGVVTGYNYAATFFGPGATVPILEVEENS